MFGLHTNICIDLTKCDIINVPGLFVFVNGFFSRDYCFRREMLFVLVCWIINVNGALIVAS